LARSRFVDGSEDGVVDARGFEPLDVTAEELLVFHQLGVDQHFDADVRTRSRRSS
jgi:hypothetical protein